MNQHFDPERVAALMDGSLPRAERAVMEAHAADCTDCLQLLAAVARTEPPPSTGRPPMSVRLRWAVPIAATAAAVALWVNVDSNRRESERPRPEAAPIDAVSAQPPPPSPASKEADAGAQAPREARSKTEKPTTSGDVTRADPSRNERTLAKETAPAPAAPPSVLEDSSLAGAPRQNVAAQARQAQRTRHIEVLAPNQAVRWRAAGGVIEGSIDRGKTWGAQFTVLHTEILAGASAAPENAWFVGSGGFVARTTDGKDWQQRPFPEPVDLVAVQATGAAAAQVTTRDGRVFHTRDGGQTWTLQETPGSSF